MSGVAVHPRGDSGWSQNSSVYTMNTTEKSPDFLQQFNNEKAFLYMPVFIYIAILMTIGVLGNTLVLYIYIFTRDFHNKTTSYNFIIFMALVDLLLCAVGMPTEIYDLLHTVTFNSSAACKILRYTEAVAIQATALVLVAIAIDRYNQICRPVRALLYKNTTTACVGIAVYSLFTTTPTLLIYGLKPVSIRNDSLVGKDCSVPDEQIIPGLAEGWYGYVALLFVVSVIIIIALYIRVWIYIRQRHKKKIKEVRRKHASHELSSRDNIVPDMSEPNIRDITEAKTRDIPLVRVTVTEIREVPIIRVSTTDNCDTPKVHNSNEIDVNGISPQSVTLRDKPIPAPDSSENIHGDKSLSPAPDSSRASSICRSTSQLHINVDEEASADARMNRTTKILFTVTVAFIISYLPALVVAIFKLINDTSTTVTSEVLDKILTKSFFINNAINPIIYSFMNVAFRREIIVLFHRLKSGMSCRRT